MYPPPQGPYGGGPPRPYPSQPYGGQGYGFPGGPPAGPPGAYGSGPPGGYAGYQGGYPPAQNAQQPYGGGYQQPITQQPITQQPTSSRRSRSRSRSSRPPVPQMNVTPALPPIQPPETIPPGCPPGLEFLVNMDHLFVQQQLEYLEIMSGFETDNRYKIFNKLGQPVYYAMESSDFCAKQCCANNRAFTMQVIDIRGREVMSFSRKCGCMCCLTPCCCCMHIMHVEAPPGNPIGCIRQEYRSCAPLFSLRDASLQPTLFIEADCCVGWYGHAKFALKTRDRSRVIGQVTKQWSGFAQEVVTDADNFGISFPADLDVHTKALIVASCILLDFMFFEN